MRLSIGSEELKLLLKAGDIASRARDYGAQLVTPGKKASEICEAVESYIRELGGKPAFPCNLSINDVAAHYTPGLRDDVVIPDDAVVKIDVGVHIDGYIADTATTVDLSGKYEKLLEASLSALEAVKQKIRPGISVYELGKIIGSEIRRRGFKPIKNLYGHTIDRYNLHAGVSIPNYPERLFFGFKLPPGTVVAIEPFATNGKGHVKEGSVVNIYSYTGKRAKVRLSELEERVLDTIIREYRTLPFTPRWLLRSINVDVDVLDSIIKSLKSKKLLNAYPILVESAHGFVAQFEHTFIILEDQVIVSTVSKEEEF